MGNNPVVYENNSLIGTYNLRKEIARKSITSPTLTATGNYLFAPTFNGFGYDSSITNGGLYSALLNFDYPLFKGAALNLKLKSTELDQNTYMNTILTTRHDLEKNITEQYIKAYFDYKQIDFIKEQIELLNTERRVVIALASNGFYKISDIKLLEIETQGQIINLKKQEIQYRQDLLDLNVLAGVKDTSYHIISEPELRLNMQAVEKSNFLTQYELDAMKLELDQSQLELNYKPQVDIFANAGLNAVTYIDIEKKIGFSTGFNLTFSLYDGNQVDLNRQLTTIRKNIAQNNKNNFIRLNGIRKENILKKIDDLDSLTAEQEKQIENYKSLLDVYGSEISTAQLSVIDYINELKNFYTAKNDLLSTQNQKIVLIDEYNYWNW